MKRSAVNTALRTADALLADYRFALPVWARWKTQDFARDDDLRNYLSEHQMGWDVTDFGTGDFARCGLTLFCVRNGKQGDAKSIPYAEKLLFVGEDQETPFHCHKVKMEDIINRGGGNLIVEFRHENGEDDPINIHVDGQTVTLKPDDPLKLLPGQSVTIPRGLFHRFYGEPGHGMVFCGEVSQVNDDNADNYFLEPLGRFSDIDEDEPPLYPLWNEIG